MHKETKHITALIEKAAVDARKRFGDVAKADCSQKVKWPVVCEIGPGLEGAIACESKIGYVNGSAGELIYQGYDIFDLCAYSSFEEVSYLLLKGSLPTKSQLKSFTEKLVKYRYLPKTLRKTMSMSIEDMHPMAALRLGTHFMRQRLTWRDSYLAHTSEGAIASDEDSIPMEVAPFGERKAVYEFPQKRLMKPAGVQSADDAKSMDSCLHLVSGLATIAAAIARMRGHKMPVEPDASLSHAANFLYMMTGNKPTPEEERVMDVSLILHADHGMNASTFASMVVASTMSDVYLSVGAGISALSGPLHGGANEEVVTTLEHIGDAKSVSAWYARMRKKKKVIPGFGHRVYKTYDPRALILGPLVKSLAKKNKTVRPFLQTAEALEKKVVASLGKKKGIYPNVDFYSGMLYTCLGIPKEMFTPIFAVSRVSGWTARVNEYLKKNRIFRPRAMYTGEFGKKYTPIGRRRKKKS
jgi:citrate synthase